MNDVVVASLGWVTPGAATEGVTPLFFPENLATFFLLITIVVGCHLFTCPTSLFLHYSLSIGPQIVLSFWCHPPGGCHPGRSAPRTAPTSDATGNNDLVSSLSGDDYVELESAVDGCRETSRRRVVRAANIRHDAVKNDRCLMSVCGL